MVTGLVTRRSGDRIVPRAAKTDTPIETPLDQPPAAPLKPTIRIATFNLDGLDDSRLANPKVSEGLVRILSTYLGHTHPRHTYWYLQAAPELMAIAGQRLEAAQESRS